VTHASVFIFECSVGVSSPASHGWQRTASLGEASFVESDAKNLFATSAFVDGCDADSSSLTNDESAHAPPQPSLPRSPTYDTRISRNAAAAVEDDEDRAYLSPSEVEDHFKRQLEAECNAPFNALREWFQSLPGLPTCLPPNQNLPTGNFTP